MPKRRPVRGIDHLGITVPDLEVASRFVEEAFDAKLLFDNLKRSDALFAGPEAEAMVGLAPGAVLVPCG
jgi:catechol 2,3-dioxygenase-like lactoylglutathione lyase family enzyme